MPKTALDYLREAAGQSTSTGAVQTAPVQSAQQPVSVSKNKTALDYLREAAGQRDDILQQDYGDYKSVYGNIDLANRDRIDWDKKTVRQWSSQLESLGYKPKDLLNTHSTVMGSSGGYGKNGIEVAYSPILQNGKGGEILSQKDIDTYIGTLVDSLPDGWTEADLLAADRNGLTVNGRTIKGIIAGAGDNARTIGEEMHKASEYAEESARKAKADATNPDKIKYDELVNNEDFAEKSKVDTSARDAIGILSTIFGQSDNKYDYINNINGYADKVNSATDEEDRDDNVVRFKFMSEDEKRIYNYLFNTKGAKAADKYLDTISPELDRQLTEQVSKTVTDWEQESAVNKAIGTVGTIATAPVRQTLNMGGNAYDYLTRWTNKVGLTDKTLNPYSAVRRMGNITNDVRETAKEDMSGLGQFAYDIGVMGVENFYMGKLMGAYGSAMGYSGGKLEKFVTKAVSGLMSSDVMANAIRSGKEKGYSDETAVDVGLVHGAIEYWTEKIGMDWIFKGEPKTVLKRLGRSTVAEALEELAGNTASEAAFHHYIDKKWGTSESVVDEMVEYYKTNGTEWQKENPFDAAWMYFFGDSAKSAAWQYFAKDTGLAMASAGLSAFGTSAATSYVSKVAQSTDPRVIEQRINEAQQVGDEAMRNRVGNSELVEDSSTDKQTFNESDFESIEDETDNEETEDYEDDNEEAEEESEEDEELEKEVLDEESNETLPTEESSDNSVNFGENKYSELEQRIIDSGQKYIDVDGGTSSIYQDAIDSLVEKGVLEIAMDNEFQTTYRFTDAYNNYINGTTATTTQSQSPNAQQSNNSSTVTQSQQSTQQNAQQQNQSNQQQQQGNQQNSKHTPNFGNDTAETQTHSIDEMESDLSADDKEDMGIDKKSDTHTVHHNDDVDNLAQQYLNQDKAGEKARLFTANQDGEYQWDNPDIDTVMAHALMEEEFEKQFNLGKNADWTEYLRMRDVWKHQMADAARQMYQASRYAGNETDALMDAVDKILKGKLRKGSITKNDAIQRVAQQIRALNGIGTNDTQGMLDFIKSMWRIRGGGQGVINKITTNLASHKLDTVVANLPNANEVLRDMCNQSVLNYASDFVEVPTAEKVNAVHYINMLSKPSTVVKNFVGNSGLGILDSTSNNIGVLADKFFEKFTGKRSVATEVTIGNKATRKAAENAFWTSYCRVCLDIDTGNGKYGMNGTARTFRQSGNVMERIFGDMQMIQGILLKSTDERAKGTVRELGRQSMQKLIDAGKISSHDANANIELNALDRTLQADSKTAQLAKRVRNTANNFSVLGIEAGSMAMPFAEVPANQIAMTSKYIPLGGALSILNDYNDIAKEYAKSHDGTRGSVREVLSSMNSQQQRQMAIDFGRSINGAALVAFFVACAAKGIVLWTDDDDRDKAALQKSQGQKGIQINLSAIQRAMDGVGDTSLQDGDDLLSLGFMEVLSANMALGSMIYDDYEENGTLNGEDIASSSLRALWESALEFPAISNITSSINAFKYSDSEDIAGKVTDAVATFAGSTASSYLVPNILRGHVTGSDYVDRNTSLGSSRENALSYISAGLPGARETLPEKLNGWGETYTPSGNDTYNYLNNTVLPSFLTKYSQDDRTDEIERVVDSVGNTKIAPNRNGAMQIDGVKLEPHERQQYQRVYGSYYGDAVDALLDSTVYKSLDTVTQNDILTKAESMAVKAAEQDWGKEYKSTTITPASLEKYGVDPVDYLLVSYYGDYNDGGNTSQESLYYAIKGLGLESKADNLWALFGSTTKNGHYKDSYGSYTPPRKK